MFLLCENAGTCAPVVCHTGDNNSSRRWLQDSAVDPHKLASV